MLEEMKARFRNSETVRVALCAALDAVEVPEYERAFFDADKSFILALAHLHGTQMGESSSSVESAIPAALYLWRFERRVSLAVARLCVDAVLDDVERGFIEEKLKEYDHTYFGVSPKQQALCETHAVIMSFLQTMDLNAIAAQHLKEKVWREEIAHDWNGQDMRDNLKLKPYALLWHIAIGLVPLAKELALKEREKLRKREKQAPGVGIGIAKGLIYTMDATHIEFEPKKGTIFHQADESQKFLHSAVALDVARGVLEDRKVKDAVAVLTPYLVHQAYRQWSKGVAEYRMVDVPLGRELKAKFGMQLTDEQIERALQWLMSCRVAERPFVNNRWVDVKAKPKGGNPKTKLTVEVGSPLAPYGLAEVYKLHGKELPRELRFYAPVFDVRDVPLVGNRQTFARQRVAGSLGLGAALMPLREEYASKGGVLLSSLVRPLRELGCYVRSHQSLVADMLAGWTSKNAQPDMFSEKKALLVVTETGGSRVELANAEAHAMLLEAAGVSVQGRLRQGLKGKKRRRVVKKKT